MDVKDIRKKDEERIYKAQDRDRFLASVRAVKNQRVI
jgi:hypothetical protein